MEKFLKIIREIMKKSGMQYDIFLLSDMITGFCLNSKYTFPVHDFSEALYEKYHAKYREGYFNILHDYEGERAVDLFMEYACTCQIAIDNREKAGNLRGRLCFILSEIEKRPGQYLSECDIKHVKAFLDGHLAGEDLILQIPIGDSMSALELEIDKYVSKEHGLYGEKPWYDKLRDRDAGFAGDVRVVVAALDGLESK